ncbi:MULTISPECIES: tetratricopeptide repeat protein [unclassified Carboxylicivirga]|uniref:tetratricopeptide repeat protein n=1 Tax=Carboxylicivirga TaxID=1628153 RepID=UPI003D32DBAF
MKKLLILLSAAVLTACNPLAKLPGLQENATNAFDNGNYEKAYTLYAEYINLANDNNAILDESILINQAHTCAKLDKIDEAASLYDQLLQDENNIDLLIDYAQMLQDAGREDAELKLWNEQADKIKEAKLQSLKTERLIALNAIQENHNAVIEVFENKGDVSVTKEAHLAYVNALSGIEKEVEAAKACNDLLKTHPNYQDALEWKAKYYYNKAEERYKYEMAKYNKNKNATSYAYLRRDLKKISVHYRIARDTFIKLHEMDPSNRAYMKYLKNVYLRLDQNKEAAQMDKLLK